MKPLIILTSLNFVVCCLLVIKSRIGDNTPPPPQPAERVIPVINPDEEPDNMNLKELLDKPRAELARIANDYEEQIFHQEKKRQQGELTFKLLPLSTRFPMAWPIWRQAKYSAQRDMVLPPYLSETGFDSNLALHLARFGDVEAARKIVEPNDTAALAEIERLALRRNYPAEWTRAVAMILHRAHYSLAEANNNGARKVVALHRQLSALLNDDEVRQSRLATTLLSRGRSLIHAAVVAWAESEGQEEYVELGSVGTADWGTSAAPVLPPARTPAELAAWLGGETRGLMVRSGDTLRALDMLELPLPNQGAEGVVGLFSPKGNLREILVVYGNIDDVYETRRLTYWLDEQFANSSRLNATFDFEKYPLEKKETETFVTPRSIVRLSPRKRRAHRRHGRVTAAARFRQDPPGSDF